MSGISDLRYAIRMLAKTPGATAAAVLSLAIAIGPNAALFSVVDKFFLTPPSVEGIRDFYTLNLRTGSTGGYDSPSYPDLVEYRAETREVADLIASEGHLALVEDGGIKEMAPVGYVTENFFEVMRTRALLGRVLVESDTRSTGAPPVVISHGLWQRRFGGAANVIGRRVLINQLDFYIAGVLPRGFRGPSGNLLPPDVFIPMTGLSRVAGGRYTLDRNNRSLNVNVRLRSGASPARVESILTATAARLAREYPKTNRGKTVRLTPLDEPGRHVFGWILLSVVGLVLLIACANITGILLAKGESRRQEFAVRLALGASRGRLARQLAVEVLALSGAAAALGLVMAGWLMRLLPALQPSLPVTVDLGLGVNASVVVYTAVLAVVAAMAAGLAPALRFSAPAADLRRGRSRLRSGLIVAQIAVAQFLLAGGALLTRSYLEVRQIRPGFDPNRHLLLAIILPKAPYDFRALSGRLAAVPGVLRVTSVHHPPISGSGDQTRRVTVDGATVDVKGNSAGPEYLTTIGARMLVGRDFADREPAESAIVNEAMARRFWGRPEAAVGRSFRSDDRDVRVVGVVENGKYQSLTEDPIPYLFTSVKSSGVLVIETAGEPGMVAPAVRDAFRASPEADLASMTTWREHLRLSLFVWQAGSVMLGTVAALGILLAGVGLYGLVSYGVHRRAHEIGVRMALGARSVDVLRLVTRQAARMVAIGSAVGLVAVVVVARVLSAILYRVSPGDPAALLGAAAVVALVTVAAAFHPAQRATRVDPMTVLRAE